jgi:hypothetical protein
MGIIYKICNLYADGENREDLKFQPNPWMRISGQNVYTIRFQN